jgi:hypothetical protein
MDKIRIMVLITKMANTDDKLMRLFIADRIFELLNEEKAQASEEFRKDPGKWFRDNTPNVAIDERGDDSSKYEGMTKDEEEKHESM